MSINVGRLGWLGIAIETTPGTPVSPTDYIPYTANTMQGMHTPIEDIASRGIVEKQFNSVIGKKWGAGAVTINLDPTLSGYFFKMALGSEAAPTQIGSSGVYQHVFTVPELSLPTSSTITFDKVAFREFYPYTVMQDYTVTVADGLATATANLLSQFPQTSVSGSNTATSGTVFTFKDLNIQFGSNISIASAATPQKVKKVELKFNFNPEAIYRSGNPTPDSYANKGFEVTGSFDILLEGTTHRDWYYNLSKEAMILNFTGAVIGVGGITEQVQIRLYKIHLNDFKIDSGIDNLFSASASFVAEYSLADTRLVDVTLTNKKITSY